VVGPQTTQSTDQQSNIDLGNVYVLSLPSFTWHSTALNPKHSRAKHTCNVAGNRQMIVVGGITANVADAEQTKDTRTQGLGIFDLTELGWKTSYDASAAAYQTPDIVKQYISTNGPYPATWDSETVASFLSSKGEFHVSGVGFSLTSHKPLQIRAVHLVQRAPARARAPEVEAAIPAPSSEASWAA
jgi:hypothetical protein